ncbi:DNA-binding transcriptional regulator, MocR family, contains an aminotransferase domain [Geodermatophilus obscurus]|uniref:DNA-binding transcriptional regulator, MocR family, contains an aminotransferase domain n=1 Tax=Geodermatophilus obscurus TaxID=1861 RepID=A0A1I5EBU7_9ACTN|nr:PLP-dependent aminotransferase family protein [Geodermatophilus obscurus]SFO08850.1 DNA-binding transcriptional regulator, MocR family, contains an aminotransferase domain [Geodermatophilus obscurus]
MDSTSARGLAALVGDLGTERPPRYAALAGRIRRLVAEGRVPLGTRLPAERELAQALAVSRATVTAAYTRLREDGWATARQGAGTFAVLPRGPHHGAWVPGPADDGSIDLAHAAPAAPASVPAALATALEELPRFLGAHGYHPAGLPDLRARVADRYTARGLPTTPEQVLVTGGALHGVSTAFGLLLRRGTRLLVEQPSYPNALQAARASGARVLPVALDPDDPAAWLDATERALAAARPAAAYLMPDFQNPTGALLDVAGRERLAAALRRAGVPAVVDETLAELGLDTAAPPPLAAFGNGAPSVGTLSVGVLSVGTLSKVAWGGLRVGWVRAEADVVRRLTAVAVQTSLSGPVVEQLAACALLDGLDASLAELRAGLRERRAVLTAELRRRLPGWLVPEPPGGLVLWCGLPTPRSRAVVAAAERLGLRLAAGPLFGTGHALDDRLRLPYTQPPDVLRRAVGLLVRADAEATGAAVPDGPAGDPRAVSVV